MSALIDNVEALDLRPLAKLTADEQLELLAIRNHPDLRGFMMTAHEIGSDEHLAWIERMRGDDRAQFFAAFVGPEMVGAVGMSGLSDVDRRADWGFYLHPDCQGRGLGVALGYKFLDHAFQHVEKLNAEVIAFNAASLAMHRKLGFKDEGIRRRHVRRDGDYHDAILLGITAAEWQDRRRQLTEGSIG